MLPSLLAALLVLPLRAPTPTAPPADTVVAFVNVAVIPMDREQVLADQTVLVQGGRISAIGPAATTKIPDDARRVDGRGKFLIPGLGDMHAHFFDFSPTPQPTQFANFLAAFVANGVTTVRLMAGAPWQFDLRARVAKGELLGPTLYLSTPQLQQLDSPETALQLVADYKAAGYDMIKIYLRVGEFSPEAVESLTVAAPRAGLPFGGHIPEGMDGSDWFDMRPATVDHAIAYFAFFQNGLTTKEFAPQEDRIDETFLGQIAKVVKRSGTWQVPTLSILFSDVIAERDYGLTPENRRFFVDKVNHIVRAFHDAGVPFLTGTDASVIAGPVVGYDMSTMDGMLSHKEVRPGLSIHRELELLVAAGFTPYQALEASTRNVAAHLNTLDRTGTIEVGKRADLVLLSANPLQDIRHTAHPAGVMLGGRWISREEFKTHLGALEVPDDWW